MKIRIGESVPDGRAVHLDVKNLIYSRALIQANSGGGKTGLLRVIAEQVAAHIPTIIIDKEGEYHTLREKVDLILVGERGELAADVRSAGLLARKLVELGASAVIDLSDFTKAAPQHEFVKNFLDALIYLPRSLWHPTFIMIDEAHVFSPEKGMGESAALESVVNLMTLGRKRGFGGILATTRLAKLHKNAADANNVFIGRTVLDVDQQRAVKALGFKAKDNVMLRDLEQRHFYAFGPDLDFNGVIQFRTSDCQTTIPKAGEKKGLIPPAASSVVKDLAEKLKDLPQEAEQEIHTLADAKRQVALLTAEIRKLKAGQQPREQDTQRIAQLETELEKARAKVKTEHKVVEKKVVLAPELARLEKIPEQYEALIAKLAAIQLEAQTRSAAIKDLITGAQALNAAQLQVAELPLGPKDVVAVAQMPFRRDSVASRIGGGGPLSGPVSVNISRLKSATGAHSIAAANGDFTPTGKQQEILNALAWWESVGNTSPTLPQVGAVALIAAPSGHFNNLVGPLSSNGLVQREGGRLCLTDGGRARAAVPAIAPSLDDYHVALRERVLNSRKATPRTVDMLNVIIDCGGREVSLKEIGELASIAYPSGHFNNTFGPLSTLGLVKRTGGVARPTEILFPPDL